MKPDRIVAYAVAIALATFVTDELLAQSSAPGKQQGGVAGAGAIPGGVPGMSGIIPNRAELADSAFTKLDGRNRGYLTLEDVRQLEGFDSAFREADRNADGRLDATEFNTAWGKYTGNAR